jgi:M6 family metalloprotease-like protein
MAAISYWLAEPHDPLPAVRLDGAPDVAVVGGGITGCSCALALAEAGLQVRLYEAREIAGGASGRNGGFALRGGSAPYPVLAESIGSEQTAALWRWTEAELAELATLAGDAYRPTGSLRLAADEEEHEELRVEYEALRAGGFAVEWRDELPPPLAERYPGAIFHPSDGVLQPARLVRRLALRAAEAGVEIREHTRVGSTGETGAETVVIATDGYPSGLLGELEGLIVPTRGQVIATEPIEERLFEVPHYGRHGFDYWHQAPDGRIVAGGFRDVSLDTEFTVFGVHLGTPRKPLVLPRAFASYFYDEFSPGGIETIMPGDWTNPLALDGTETLTLRSDPAVGVGKDYAVPFAALWTTRTHNSYPVAVNFAGTETLQIDVDDQTGTLRTLNLTFAPLSLSHAQGDDEAAFLQAIGQHVTNAIRAAETATGSPVVLQDVVFRRIRQSSNDAEFGRLQGQFRVATAGGATQKGQVTLTPPGSPPAALGVLGLTGMGARSGVLGSAAQVGSYLGECLHAARFESGEGMGQNDPHLDSAVETEEDAVAQTVRVRIKLAEDKGGAGAEITRVSSAGHTASGWSTAVPVPGSESTKNNRNTMRYHQDLANDVFTAAMDHIRATSVWNTEAVRAQFADFDAMMIGFVGACPTTVPVADRWNAANAVDFTRLRMFVRYHQATDLNNPNPADSPVTLGTDLLIGQRFNQFDPGVMSHEIGHGLGLPDLYSATGFRDDVVYVDDWCQMAGSNGRFNHFCAWSKWSVDWIVDDPGDPALNRVVDVPMPDPSATTETEAWLCPVEYWDGTMRADIEAEVGTGLPIGQMMKVHLGSDGGVVDLIELRTRGQAFSQQLPPTPAVIVTNVLQPGTDRRWAVNGLYRRSVHLLNQGKELRSVGDIFNFAAAPEFPLKGCTVELVDLRTIRSGTIPICRLKVVREPAEFIDLFFQDNIPSWRSPDIWVDWPGDNPDPTVPRVYPEGTPTDQGEVVRFPSSGVEPHFLVPRPHNAGNVRAEDVKVRWFICDPPGAGDDGRWVQRDTMTIPQIDGDTWDIAPFTWNVDPATSSHQCLRAEIIDWTIPTGVDPATGDTLALGSDDVLLQNNNAQKNVFDFEATT